MLKRPVPKHVAISCLGISLVIAGCQGNSDDIERRLSGLEGRVVALESAAKKEVQRKFLRVKQSASLRAKPSRSSTRIGVASAGTIVQRAGQTNSGWTPISFRLGELAIQAWIADELVEEDTNIWATSGLPDQRGLITMDLSERVKSLANQRAMRMIAICVTTEQSRNPASPQLEQLMNILISPDASGLPVSGISDVIIVETDEISASTPSSKIRDFCVSKGVDGLLSYRSESANVVLITMHDASGSPILHGRYDLMASE